MDSSYIESTLVTGSYQEHIPLLLYPNPSHGSFYAETFSTGSNVATSVYDITGELLYHHFDDHTWPGPYRININIPQLSPGIYFVELDNNGKSARAKFIHQ
jgi:hypothetical protein